MPDKYLKCNLQSRQRRDLSLAGLIIGIDLGGTNTRIGLLDSRLAIKDKIVFSTRKFSRKDALINELRGQIFELLRRNKIKREKVRGIGIGLPGPIDSRGGVVYYFPNIPGWKDVPLAAILRKKTAIPVLIDNDVNLITLAEFKRGAGRGARNMVCLTLGTGVGGGIIVEGKLYRGSSLSAGELGHIPVSIGGPKCGCGSRGCLESYIGNHHILKLARKLLRINKLEDLSAKAREGNKKAIGIWRQIGGYLGLALCGVINFFNPERIIIGGGVSGAGEALFSAVREVIKKRAMAPAKNIVKIAKCQLGDRAGIIGAALLVLESDESK